MKNLTEKKYWGNQYAMRNRQLPLNVSGFRNYIKLLILNKLLETNIENKRGLEIGAGDSAWLPYLAKNFPSAQFVGLDYTEKGCDLLSERAHLSGVNIDVVYEDMYIESSKIHGTFDVVFSYGVVEHFDNLSHALSAKKRYLNHDGVMFTIIPNLAGVLGLLVRIWNNEVYKKHVPHDLDSFLIGHQQAGLDVVACGYLGSSNFGVLTGCFPERRGLAWQISRALAVISVLIWSVEKRIGNIPSTELFSPYIYAISRPK